MAAGAPITGRQVIHLVEDLNDLFSLLPLVFGAFMFAGVCLDGTSSLSMELQLANEAL